MASIDRKTINKYYFIVKSTQTTWIPILSPFVMSSNTENAGEFLSSSWYKNAIPDEYECAVIRITIDIAEPKKQAMADAMRIIECMSAMNNYTGTHILDLNFVIMHHFMEKQYLLAIHRKLRKLLKNNNSDTATTHATMHTAAGTFGMSFALRENEMPHMYCPSFTLE